MRVDAVDDVDESETNFLQSSTVKHQSVDQNIQEDDVLMQDTQKVSQMQPNIEITQEREPKLYVDVNVASFGLQRIVVYEGDTVESLVSDFVQKCPIDDVMVEKLKGLLKQQIDGVLERIDEDEEQKTDNSAEEHYDENGNLTSPGQKQGQIEGAGKHSSSEKQG